MNPFRSEASAYRFLFFAIGGLAAIAVALHAGGGVAGLIVLAILSLTAFLSLAAFVRGRPTRQSERPRPIATHGKDGVRRILVVANETLGGSRLFGEIRSRSEGYDEQVLVVCPALNSALRHWMSDEDGARAAAQRRLEASLGKLAAAGIDARGEIGDAHPLQAIEDALRIFGADEIIISTHPPERSNWLARGVVAKARSRFTVPVTHVIGEEAELEAVDAVQAMGATSAA